MALHPLIRRLLGDTQGTVLAEAAIVLPFLALILGMTWHFGFAGSAMVRTQAAAGYVEQRHTRGLPSQDTDWAGYLDAVFDVQPEDDVVSQSTKGVLIGSNYRNMFPRGIRSGAVSWTLPTTYTDLEIRRKVPLKADRATWTRRPLGGQPVMLTTQILGFGISGAGLIDLAQTSSGAVPGLGAAADAIQEEHDNGELDDDRAQAAGTVADALLGDTNGALGGALDASGILDGALNSAIPGLEETGLDVGALLSGDGSALLDPLLDAALGSLLSGAFGGLSDAAGIPEGGSSQP